MKLDEKHCPLCGGENRCMADSEEECWCTKENVPKGIIELVPEEAKDKYCICHNCIDNYKK